MRKYLFKVNNKNTRPKDVIRRPSLLTLNRYLSVGKHAPLTGRDLLTSSQEDTKVMALGVILFLLTWNKSLSR